MTALPKCPKHPKYQAKRAPKTCRICWDIYDIKQLADKLYKAAYDFFVRYPEANPHLKRKGARQWQKP